MRLSDRAEDLMYEVTEEIDVDRFMFEVWGSFPDGSEVEQEIEAKFEAENKTTWRRKTHQYVKTNQSNENR
jgi:hypothetical protein